MSKNIRFPKITATGTEAQINQIKSYLHQLVEQLNWLLSTEATKPTGESSQVPAEWLTEETVNELKHLITQSTSMLDSYYEQIDIKLSGKYVPKTEYMVHKESVLHILNGLSDTYLSKTDFGTYQENLEQSISDLNDKFVSQDTFDDYRGAVEKQFTGLGEAYVPAETYAADKRNIEAAISALQDSIKELSDRIDEIQKTGGE